METEECQEQRLPFQDSYASIAMKELPLTPNWHNLEHLIYEQCTVKSKNGKIFKRLTKNISSRNKILIIVNVLVNIIVNLTLKMIQ